MPAKKFIDPKSASTYRLAYKSVEDPSYEDEKSATTLTHVSKRSNARAPGYQGDVLNEDMRYAYDMQNPNDDDVAGVFEDEAYEDFGQDFIRQMMQAPEEEEEEVDMGEYPQHKAAKRDVDLEFAALMKDEYNVHDMELEEGDPRTEGPLPVDAYVPALQDFVQGQKQGHFLQTEKHEGFVDRLQPTGEEIFHMNAGGKFYTVLRSKKDIDLVEDYETGLDEAKQVALERLQYSEKQKLEAGEEEEDELKYEYVKIKEPAKAFDCQTVLTSLSTLENHPTIIAAEKGRIKVTKKGVLLRTNNLNMKNLEALGEAKPLEQLLDDRKAGASADSEADQDAGSDAEKGSAGEESFITIIDTTVGREKNETPEEKKARKQQIKQLKKESREAKKHMKTAYKAETIRQRVLDPISKQEKAQLSLR
ncbi:Protein LTV1-like protein [Diplonema papillatum]|nr:Protein LTV1-like protein [Diplonema papillatum]